MKTYRGPTFYGAVIWAFALALTLVSVGHAFSNDEEQQLQIDLREARARATDFKAHVKRLEESERNRERFAQESKVIRQRDEEILERGRIIFIQKRNAQVPDDAIRERLEREFDAEKERKDQNMDVARREFLRKKRAVTETIDREASIDANVEFGLTPNP